MKKDKDRSNHHMNNNNPHKLISIKSIMKVVTIVKNWRKEHILKMKKWISNRNKYNNKWKNNFLERRSPHKTMKKKINSQICLKNISSKTMNKIHDKYFEFNKIYYHSYNVAISHNAKWYFGELINFFPNNIPFPTNDWGVGGFGIEFVITVNK